MEHTTLDPEKVVNLRGAEKIVGVGTSTIRYWILAGKLKATRNERGRWEIRVGDLLEADRLSREGTYAQPRGRKGRLKPYGPELRGRPVTEPVPSSETTGPNGGLTDRSTSPSGTPEPSPTPSLDPSSEARLSSGSTKTAD